jgi:hypothetical protein
MLDDIVQLADNLWLVVGDLSADIPNSIVYRQRDRLYLMDSGVGATIRASIIPDMGSLNMDFFCTRNGKKFFCLLLSYGHNCAFGMCEDSRGYASEQKAFEPCPSPCSDYYEVDVTLLRIIY